MLEQRRILIVEDDEDVLETLADALIERGYEIVTAANGRAALEIVQAAPPDLVFIDLMMPVMDGWELIDRLRAKETHFAAPIIILSAVDDVEHIAAELAVDGFLRKPFGLGEVVQMIETQLRAAPLS